MSEALFGESEVHALQPAGKVEAALRRALDAGTESGTIVAVDEALAESALVLARVLDAADRVGGLKGGYLASQAQPPFQRACHALRLPAELTAVAPPPPQAAPDGQTGAPSWVDDYFGRAE